MMEAAETGAGEASTTPLADEMVPAKQACAVVLVEVRTIGGQLVTRLAVAPHNTVGALKQHILQAESNSWRLGQPRLICGCAPLADSRRLGDCLSQGQYRTLSLTLVHSGPSSLASQVAFLEQGGCLAGGLTEIADGAFQDEHATSQQYQPEVRNILLAMDRETRIQVIGWLGMACEATLVDDALLHGAVLTLDRYAATYGRRIDESKLLRLSLASLCTEMKLTSEDAFPPGHWQRVLFHLSQGREQLPDILHAEALMLRRLQFVVGVPTPSVFLFGLGLRLAGPDEKSRDPDGRPGALSTAAALQLALARVLVELALYDVELEYRYPSVVLAASALGAALLTVGTGSALETFGLATHAGTVANPAEMVEIQSRHGVLLEDLASYCPALHSRCTMVRECEQALLVFWQACRQGLGRLTESLGHLFQRHARSRRVTVHSCGRGPPLGAALLSLVPETGLDRWHQLYSAPPPEILADI